MSKEGYFFAAFPAPQLTIKTINGDGTSVVAIVIEDSSGRVEVSADAIGRYMEEGVDPVEDRGTRVFTHEESDDRAVIVAPNGYEYNFHREALELALKAYYRLSTINDAYLKLMNDVDDSFLDALEKLTDQHLGHSDLAH